MRHADLVLPALGVLVALGIALRSFLRPGRWPLDPLGLLAAALGVWLALQNVGARRLAVPFLKVPDRNVEGLLAGHTGGAPQRGDAPGLPGLAFDLGAGHTRPQSRQLDLSVPGLDLGGALRAAAAGPGRGVVLLQGGAGIRDEYRPWLEARFGALQPRPGPPAPVCFRRTPLLPYASALCPLRPISFTLPASDTDIAREPRGQAVLALRAEGPAAVVLAAATFGDPPAPEERCLAALARGRACAAVEVTPGAALATVALSPEGDAPSLARGVLSEFRVRPLEPGDEALRLYARQGASAAGDELVSDRDQPRFCGGLLEGGGVLAQRHDAVAQALAAARSEAELTALLELVDADWSCPGPAHVSVPSLGLRNERAGLRSLITQLGERPFWITDPASFRNRAEKVASVLGAVGDDRTLWLEAREPVEDLAVTLTAPFPLDDEALRRIDVHHQGRWQVLRVSATAVRVSLDRAALAGLSFGGTLEAPPALTGPLHRPGLLGSALIAFVIGGVLSIVQGFAGDRRTGAASANATFLGLAAVVFPLLWGSYRASLRPGRGETSVSRSEQPPAPVHVFFRDWPEAWFHDRRAPVVAAAAAPAARSRPAPDRASPPAPPPAPPARPAGAAAHAPGSDGALAAAPRAERPPAPAAEALVSTSAPAAAELAAEQGETASAPGEAEAKEEDPHAPEQASEAGEGGAGAAPGLGEVRVVDFGSIKRAALNGPQRIVVWDDPDARNHHFRRNPAYEGILAGWRLLAAKSDQRVQVVARADLTGLLGSPDLILVVPDLGRASRTNRQVIESWVQAGGHLVFSEVGNPGDLGPAMPAPAGDEPLLVRARNVGYSRSRVASYGRAVLDDGAPVEIKVLHRVIPGAPGEAPWWVSRREGGGRLTFLGVAPLDAATTALARELLERAAGQRLVLSDAGKGCATFLLLEPYGDTPERLARLADSLRKGGVAVRWLVDPVSFGRMLPVWREVFRRNGVVFLDDGEAEPRLLAAKLWRALHPTAILDLASVRGVPVKRVGPPARLFRVEEVTSGEGLERWRRACLLGAAEPRLIPSRLFAEGQDEWTARLRKLGPVSFAPFEELERRLKVLHAGASGPDVATRSLGYDPERPLHPIDKEAPP
jgi:hypothetical protein